MAADKSPDTTQGPTKDVADATPNAVVVNTTQDPTKGDANATPKAVAWAVAEGEEEIENDPNNKNPVSTKENVSPEKSVEGSPDSRDTKASTSSAAVSDTNSIAEEAFGDNTAQQSIDKKRPTPLDISSPTGVSKSENFQEDGDVAIPQQPTSTTSTQVTYNTYNTYKTIESPSGMSSQKIEVIDRTKKSKTKSVSAGATALLCGMRKPACCVCLIILLGVIATNFFGWFRVPGLDDQIKRLELEIIDLEGQVDLLTISVQELSELNEDYTQLNRNLEVEVEELEQIDEELQGEVEEISAINENLNATNLEISESIVQLDSSTKELKLVEENLTASNEELKVINKALDESIDQLENSTSELESLEEQLKEDIETLEVVSENLTYQVSELENVTKGLNESVTLYERLNSDLMHEEETLRRSVGNLTTEVNSMNSTVIMLEKLEDDLIDIVEQLNDDSADLNATLIEMQGTIDEVNQEIVQLEELNSDINAYITFYGNSTDYATLNDIIEWFEEDNNKTEEDLAKRHEGLRLDHKELFEDRFNEWNCAWRYEFAGYDWAGSDETITQLDLVIEYVKKRVLDPLCMDTDNFKAFLASENITTTDFLRVVQEYGKVAEEYYYPVDDVPPMSVTTEDWINANFSCENLANQFRWVGQSV